MTRSAASRRAVPLVAAVLAGASSLLLEVVGTRLLAPVFGSGLHTWTALVLTTLAALAAGALIGGRWADRHDPAPLAAGALLAAGLLLLPLSASGLRAAILEGASDLGPRLGVVLSAATLFGPSLVCLGGVLPLTIKAWGTSLDALGQSAGRASAASTLGGLAGAAAAGFLLLPHLGALAVLGGVTALLIGGGAVGLALTWHRSALGLALLVLPLGLGVEPPPGPAGLRLLATVPGREGTVEVFEGNGRRVLVVGGVVQGGLSVMEAEGRALRVGGLLANGNAFGLFPYWRPEATRVAVVGLGAGLLSRALFQYGLTVETIDLDPAVIEVARRQFAFRLPAVVGDGRRVLRRALPGPYDGVLLDAFQGEVLPGHLVTTEALGAIKERLTATGVVGIHLLARPDSPGVSATAQTLQSVFAHTRAYRSLPSWEPQSVYLVASDAPLTPAIEPPARLLPAVLVPAPGGSVLHDGGRSLEGLLFDDMVAWRRRARARLAALGGG